MPTAARTQAPQAPSKSKSVRARAANPKRAGKPGKPALAVVPNPAPAPAKAVPTRKTKGAEENPRHRRRGRKGRRRGRRHNPMGYWAKVGLVLGGVVLVGGGGYWLYRRRKGGTGSDLGLEGSVGAPVQYGDPSLGYADYGRPGSRGRQCPIGQVMGPDGYCIPR